MCSCSLYTRGVLASGVVDRLEIVVREDRGHMNQGGFAHDVVGGPDGSCRVCFWRKTDRLLGVALCRYNARDLIASWELDVPDKRPTASAAMGTSGRLFVWFSSRLFLCNRDGTSNLLADDVQYGELFLSSFSSYDGVGLLLGPLCQEGTRRTAVNLLVFYRGIDADGSVRLYWEGMDLDVASVLGAVTLTDENVMRVRGVVIDRRFLA